MHPHSDIATEKIYGCKRGSWIWWHEKGHIEFNKLEKTSTLLMWQQYAFLFWMISTTLSVINKFMLFISIPTLLFYFGVIIYEEVWANNYANNYYSK